jgi:2,3-bisphosphoglycerate-independent phosphoglycerate mutase
MLVVSLVRIFLGPIQMGPTSAVRIWAAERIAAFIATGSDTATTVSMGMKTHAIRTGRSIIRAAEIGSAAGDGHLLVRLP